MTTPDVASPATVTINGQEITPLPLAKIYERLIDHVNGFGERHWNQDYWHKKFRPDQVGGVFFDEDCSQISELNTCGTACCIAGETVAMHVLGKPFTNHAERNWIDSAELLGVPSAMQTYAGESLFDGVRTRDEVLAELEFRHAEALKNS